MKREQLNELLLQSLENERRHPDLPDGLDVRGERGTEGGMGEIPGRNGKSRADTSRCVHHARDRSGGGDPGSRDRRNELGEAWWRRWKRLAARKSEAAQLVACECVVLAETKDHLDWDLIGECSKKVKGEDAKALKVAC